MNSSTNAKKLAAVFSDERILPMELAEQTELLLSDTGYYRMMYFMSWLHSRRTGKWTPLPEFVELLAEGKRLY